MWAFSKSVCQEHVGFPEQSHLHDYHSLYTTTNYTNSLVYSLGIGIERLLCDAELRSKSATSLLCCWCTGGFDRCNPAVRDDRIKRLTPNTTENRSAQVSTANTPAAQTLFHCSYQNFVPVGQQITINRPSFPRVTQHIIIGDIHTLQLISDRFIRLSQWVASSFTLAV